MNKFAKKISVLFTSVLLSVVLINYLYSSSSLALEKTLFNQPFKTISYTYRDTAKDDYITKKFNYSDDLFFLNSCKENGDIAKMCIALSSSAYYFDCIRDVFKNPDMGFTCDEEKYRQTYTKADNLKYGDDLDYVAYTIWHKEINGKIVYCVPIRGTPKNAEWYSNFHLGDGDDHLGFTIAAYRVLIDLYDDMNNDNYEPENTIILTTGHSRGAAVSNIIGAELSADKSIPINQIFSYNFATPAVSKNADTSLTNIYNYNNPGDLVALLPLKEWGYKRNGIDINIYPTQAYENNTYIQFKNITEGITCLSKNSPDDYSQLMLELIKSPEDFNSDFWQTVFRVVAFGLGGGSSRNEWYAIIGTDNYRGAIECGLVIVDSLGEYKSSLQKTPSSPNDLINNCCNSNIELYQTLIAFIEKHSSNVSNMTQKEFDTFKESYSSTIGKIEKTTGYSISSPSNFVASKMMIDGLLSKTNKFVSKATRIIGLFFNIGGLNAGTIITHAHDQAFYIACTNSLYFGYMGWINNTTDLCFSEEQLPNIYTIGASCFSGCTNLTNIILPESLAFIGANAFYNCSQINGQLNLPDKIVYIGDSAFLNCSNISGTISIPTGIKEIKKNTFKGCSSIKTVIIPESVTTIGASAFSGCKGIKEISIPCSTKYKTYDTDCSSSNNTFEGCSSIEYVKITGTGDMPDIKTGFSPCVGTGLPWTESYASSIEVEISEGVTSIGCLNFYSCKRLTKVTLPSTLTKIGSSAFSGCENLSGEINLPENLTYIGSFAFNGCKNIIGEISIPEGVTNIWNGTFEGCSGIEKVTIPDSVTDIGKRAFLGCKGIKEITIPCSTKYKTYETDSSSSNNTFQGCSSINHVIISGTGDMTDFTIGFTPCSGTGFPWTESYASNIEVEISEGVTSIGNFTFFSCKGLTKVTLPSTLTKIGNCAFSGCENLSGDLYLPDDLTYIGSSAFRDCKKLTGEINIPKGLSEIKAYSFYGCIGLTSISFHDGINQIGNSAFSGCTGIEELIIPESVTTIGASAFSGCKGIKEISIPCSTKYKTYDTDCSSSNNTFQGCSSINHVIVSGTGDMTDFTIGFTPCSGTGFPWTESYASNIEVEISEGVTSIGNFTFFSCKGLTKVTLPSTLTKIGNCAFSGCTGLTSLSLPKGITQINSSAFNGCNNITDIYFNSDEVDWNNINILGNNNVLFTSNKHFTYYPIYLTNTVNGSIILPTNRAKVGDEIELSVIPEIGYELEEITINGVTILNKTFTMPESNVTINATFKKISYTIEILKPINGTTTVSKSSACQGDEINICALPNEGYAVDRILVNGNPITGYTFIMPYNNVTIEVIFKLADYSVVLTETKNGSVSVSKSSANIGEEVIITAIPDIGYELDTIKVDDNVIEGNSFTMPNKSVTVTVTFKLSTFNVTVVESEHGTTTVNSSEASCGDKITINAVPDEGYEVLSVSVNGEIIEGLTFEMPDNDVEITVSYKLIDYSITINETTNGTATVSKLSANEGDEITITATPATGYELDSIKVNATVIDGTTFIMPAKDVIITVTFKKIDTAKNGWILDNGNYYYYNNGVMLTGWKNDGGKWYYLDPETGIMAKGWLDDNGTWYYFNNSGAMVTGWQSVGGKWYYFESSGAMFTGWKSSGGSWYYLTSSGEMAIGWQSAGGEWYYFESSGVMTNPGWKQIGSNWYYFKKSGAMAANEYCEGYWLNSSGTWTYKHKATWRGNSSSGWWYGDDTGWYAKNETLKIDGKEYNFNSTGYCTNP